MAAAVVVGGAGALGRAIVRALSLRRRQKAAAAAALAAAPRRLLPPIVSVDFRPYSEQGEEGEEGTHSIVLPSSPSSGEWHEAGERVMEELRALGFDYGSVFHAAGGWAGGAPGAQGFLGSVDTMWRMNGQSAALAAHVAGALLLPPSRTPSLAAAPPLVVFTGAGAALDPKACTAMLGYGMSKQATHFLARSLAAWFEEQQAGQGQGATVAAVLPTTLDTPANRAAMPTADFGGWTKPEDIAGQLAEWAFDPATRPLTGSLLKVTTKEGKTSWEPASP